MADLKTFAAFDINTTYLDVADTERGFHAAHAKGVVSDYAAVPAGATNLSNPNTYDRTLSQYNGTTYSGFNLKVDKLTTNGVLDLGFTGSSVNASAVNTFLQGDTGDYLQFIKASNIWNLAIANISRFRVAPIGAVVDSPALAATAAASMPILSLDNNNGNVSPLLITAERLAAGSNWTTASTRLQKAVDATSMAFIDFGHDGVGGIQIGAGQAATAQGVPGVLKIGGTGRTTIGASIVDDLSTMLQTGTLKATSLTLTAQPYAVIAAFNQLSSSAVTQAYLNITGIDSQVGANFTYSSVDKSITVAESGTYLLTATVGASISASNIKHTVFAPVNGAAISSGLVVGVMTNGTSDAYCNISFVLKLNALDKFQIGLVHNAAAQTYLTLAPTKLIITKLG